MAKSLDLIRHGQSTFNATYAETGLDPFEEDARLTELGRRQVSVMLWVCPTLPVLHLS